MAQQVFHKELTLREGFLVSELPKRSRLINGREVGLCSGIKLFTAMQGRPIKCWKCEAVADRWILGKGKNDKLSSPTLNLYATRTVKRKMFGKKRVLQELVMMTRDHIIPKSLGGVDLNENLRPGCEDCNSDRGHAMDEADLLFMANHPHLIDEERRLQGLENQRRAELRRQEQARARDAALT
jgi:5-methylcytosine-specific restriction endonuclease McrA